MELVNQSWNLLVVCRPALEHKLPTATALCCLKSDRWVWRCWAASRGVAWRKTSQELPHNGRDSPHYQVRLSIEKLNPISRKPSQLTKVWWIMIDLKLLSCSTQKSEPQIRVRQDFYAQVLKQRSSLGEDTINIINIYQLDTICAHDLSWIIENHGKLHH